MFLSYTVFVDTYIITLEILKYMHQSQIAPFKMRTMCGPWVYWCPILKTHLLPDIYYVNCKHFFKFISFLQIDISLLAW